MNDDQQQKPPPQNIYPEGIASNVQFGIPIITQINTIADHAVAVEEAIRKDMMPKPEAQKSESSGHGDLRAHIIGIHSYENLQDSLRDILCPFLTKFKKKRLSEEEKDEVQGLLEKMVARLRENGLLQGVTLLAVRALWLSLGFPLIPDDGILAALCVLGAALEYGSEEFCKNWQAK